MKRIVFTFLFIVAISSSFAQKIHFGDKSNVWSMIDSNIGCCIPIATVYTTAYYDSVDVTVGGYTYQYLNTSIGSVLIREEGYKIYGIITTDTVERLIYDFTLGINDTVKTAYPEDIYVAWVTQIDSTELDGQWYKVWHFEGTDTVTYYTDSVRTISYNVIEGIGCTNGPYYPIYAYTRSSFSQQLQCFNNDMHITGGLSNPVLAYGYDYYSTYDNNLSCTEFYSDHGPRVIFGTGVQNNKISNNMAIVAPNPVNDQSRLILSENIKSGTLIVGNMLGQTIINKEFSNKEEVLIGDLIREPGVYYYRVFNNENGSIYRGQITK